MVRKKMEFCVVTRSVTGIPSCIISPHAGFFTNPSVLFLLWLAITSSIGLSMLFKNDAGSYKIGHPTLLVEL